MNKRMKTKELIGVGMLLTMMAACTTAEDDGTVLETPEPVVLRAAVASQTETTATRSLTATTGQWTEGDRIALVIGGETKIYEVTRAQGGLLRAPANETPFYWTASNETKTISGWYKGSGINDVETHEMPTEWAVEADQNANDGEGLQASDFLYASPTAVHYSNRFQATITYYHQTAKVMVRLKNTGYLAEHPDAIEGVTIGDESFLIPLGGSLTLPEGENDLFGTWTLDEDSRGYIIPYMTVPTDQTTYLKVYEALVMPQNLNFKPLLTIIIGGHSYGYVPQTGQAELKAGYLNIYDIEVSEDADKIIVTPIIGGSHVWTWQQDGEVTMNDNTPAVLTVNGWKQETNPSQNVTSGIIPISISADYWTKEGESGVNYQEGEQPDKDAEGEGWQKEGGDTDADNEDSQPDKDATSQGWGKEGEDTPVTSEDPE